MSTKKSRTDRLKKEKGTKKYFVYFLATLTFIGHVKETKTLFHLLAQIFDMFSEILMKFYELANFISSFLYCFINSKGKKL